MIEMCFETMLTAALLLCDILTTSGFNLTLPDVTFWTHYRTFSIFHFPVYVVPIKIHNT